MSALSADKAGLASVAELRAEETIALFAHERPDGRSCFSALSDVNDDLGRGYAGENIASGYNLTPKAVVEAWMKSDGHRKNILSPKFSYLGVGVAFNETTGQTYWAQMFIGD